MSEWSRVKVTAIVCAYNEEKTVAGVVEALMASPLVDEVLVVDDGSTDATAEKVAPYADGTRVRLIRLPENRGKGYAMSTGILHARGEALVFADADLINLTPAYVAQYLQPLLRGEADMVIGYPVRMGDVLKELDPIRTLSGERALWRQDILPLVPALRDSRFGVETLINLYYRVQGKRVLYVPLKGLFHPTKLEKTAPWTAAWLYTREAAEIAQAVARHYTMALDAFGLNPRAWTFRVTPYLERTVGFRRALARWPRRALGPVSGLQPEEDADRVSGRPDEGRGHTS